MGQGEHHSDGHPAAAAGRAETWGDPGVLPEVSASLRVAGVTAVWTVREATVDEALDAPFEAVVEVLSESEVATRELPGRAAALRLSRAGMAPRDVVGVLRGVDDLGGFDGRHRVRFTLAPQLWLLALRVDCRIFQDLTASEIVDAVLDAAGLYCGAGERSWARVRREQQLRRECCVQYRESDLDFISRLLQDEGVAWLVDAGAAGAGRVVFFETLAGAEAVPLGEADAVAVRGAEARTARDESIRHLAWRERLGSASVTLRDYDFTHPHGLDALTVARGATGDGRAVYDYPGGYTLLGDGTDPRENHGFEYARHDGGRRAERRLQAIETDARGGEGGGNVLGFAPGRRFRVADPARAGHDGRSLVLVRVRHAYRARDAAREALDDAADAAEGYGNRFECVDADAPYRPRRVTPRPVIHGAQTAVVVAPPGEDIHVDTHGRVKVRFLWDRAPGVPDAHRSSWIRVAQAWAGGQWGFAFIPRRDMEVLVHFLEGDPDRPIVAGSVYHGAHRTAYPLDEARHRTRSWIRTQSTPAGDGGHYNELRFDDLRGHEEVALRAERDFVEQVLHDHASTVGRHETLAVGGNQRSAVGGHRTATVQHHERLTVGGGRELTVGQGDAVVIGESQTTLVNLGRGAQWATPPPPGAALKVGGRWSVEATEEIVLRVGETTLTLTAHGITLDGGQITARGEDQVRLCSKGLMTVVGTPVQLNGPGLFAGRVTEAAPDAILTGAALVVIGGPSFELPVRRRAEDGALLVGRRIVIRPETTPGSNFQGRVLRDLGIMDSTPRGRARLRNIEGNPGGHTVTIREYVQSDADALGTNGEPFGWNNSFARAQGGDPSARRDGRGRLVPGAGASSEVAYNPDIRVGPDGRPKPADATLFHELGHAEHSAYGVDRASEALDGGWDDCEEWQDIDGGINRPGGGNDIPGAPVSPSENEYLGDRAYPFRRTDHHGGYAPVEGSVGT